MSIWRRVQERTALLFVAQQGMLSPGLGALLEGDPVFTAALAACEHEIQRAAGWSLVEELAKPHDEHTSRDQPVVTALQVAWVQQLRAAGVEVAAAGGLSGGEAAAAWCCDALDLGDLLRLALQIGRLADHEASRGGMGYIRTGWGGAGELVAQVAPHVARAVEMSGDLTVIAGPAAAVDRVIEAAASRGIGGARLPFDHAYHNPLIDVLEPWYRDGLAAMRPRATRLPMYSAVTRRVHEGHAMTPEHWWHVARAPNLFYSMVQTMIADGYRRFVEVGPAPMLAETVRQAAQGTRVEVLTVDDCLRGRA